MLARDPPCANGCTSIPVHAIYLCWYLLPPPHTPLCCFFVTPVGHDWRLVAVAACDAVNVYGVGLFSEGPKASKRYMHFYDIQTGVAQCTNDTMFDGARWRQSRRFTAARANWIADRVRTELILHVLHAMRVINWVHA
jgi:hypothetical protein